MKQSRPALNIYGDGQASMKMQGLMQARKFSASAGFRELDIAAYTQKYFSDFYRRSGLLDFESEIIKNPYRKPDRRKLEELSSNAPMLKQEAEGVLQGFNEVLKPDRARVDAFLRSDEPWRAVGTGIGGSKITNKKTLEIHAKAVLTSQFHWDAILFKMMKGLADDHFGLMITNVVRNVRRKSKFEIITSPPEISINYLGQFNNKALVQHCSGFMNSQVPNTEMFDGGIPVSAKYQLFFEGLPAIISKLPGSCYLEAIRHRDNFVSDSIWTIVQYWPVEIPAVNRPEVDEKSIIFQSNRVIGTAKAATKGVNPQLTICAGNIDSLRERNTRSIAEAVEFNSGNKGYLFAASFFELEQMKQIPIAAFSNCSAMLLYSSANENEANSHINGLIRELGVPVIIITRYEEKYNLIRELAEGKLCLYTDEFKRIGEISTEVPSDMMPVEPKQGEKPSFLKRFFHL